MRSYVVDLRCECGAVHRVSNDLRLQNGPDHAGTVAELYRTGELPPELARLLGDLVWCDQAGEPEPAKLWRYETAQAGG